MTWLALVPVIVLVIANVVLVRAFASAIAGSAPLIHLRTAVRIGSGCAWILVVAASAGWTLRGELAESCAYFLAFYLAVTYLIALKRSGQRYLGQQWALWSLFAAIAVAAAQSVTDGTAHGDEVTTTWSGLTYTDKTLRWVATTYGSPAHDVDFRAHVIPNLLPVIEHCIYQKNIWIEPPAEGGVSIELETATRVPQADVMIGSTVIASFELP